MATHDERATPADNASNGTWLEVLAAFTRLGLTSFGGPVAHLGYFREEFVNRRRWLDDASYADLVALCQFLPGPASSQVGIAVGLSRAGYAGALTAWIGFTLPSAPRLRWWRRRYSAWRARWLRIASAPPWRWSRR
jgi:chromate transporter